MKNIPTNLESIARRIQGDLKAIGKEVITLAASPTINYLTVPANASWADIVIEADDPTLAADATRLVRYWYDGSTPTTTEGLPGAHLDIIRIGTAVNLNKLKILIVDTGTAVITAQVQYYKV